MCRGHLHPSLGSEVCTFTPVWVSAEAPKRETPNQIEAVLTIAFLRKGPKIATMKVGVLVEGGLFPWRDTVFLLTLEELFSPCRGQ